MPLLAPTQPWVNNSSQFANTAQGYTTYIPINAVNAFNNTNLAQNQQQLQTASNSSNSFMTPSNVAGAAKKAGEWVSNGAQVPNFFDKVSETANFGKTTAGATNGTSFLPSNYSLKLGDTTADVGGTSYKLGANDSNITDLKGFGLAKEADTAINGTNWLLGGKTTLFGSETAGGIAQGALDAGAGFLGAKVGDALFGGGGYSNAGATIGAIAGSYFGGPLGSFIGSTLGSGLGSLFGGSQPNPAGTYGGFSLDSNGTITGSGVFDGKHTSESDFQPFKQGFQNYLTQQNKTYDTKGKFNPNLGIEFMYDVNGSIFNGDSSQPAAIAIGDKTGQLPSQYFKYDPTNKDQTNAAYKAAFDYIAQQSGIDTNSQKQSNNSSGSGSGILIKQGTQGSFNEFMKKFNSGNSNVSA